MSRTRSLKWAMAGCIALALLITTPAYGALSIRINSGWDHISNALFRAGPNHVTASKDALSNSSIDKSAASTSNSLAQTNNQASTTFRLHRFVPLYMAGPTATLTQAQAVALAGHYDLIVAFKTTLAGYVPAMKAANPALIVLVYGQGTFAPPADYPASWFAHDATGKIVVSTVFPGTDLLDLSNSQLPAAIGQKCQAALAVSGYDGCFLDSLGPSGLNPSYVSAMPINPRTGHVWTVADYITATARIASYVSTSTSPRPVVGNGLMNGNAYYSPTMGPTSRLLPSLHVGMAEAWIRSASMGVTQYRPVSKWLEDVNMIGDAESQGYSATVTVKLWGTATAAQVNAYHMYSLASFLLATSGASDYSFSTGTTLSQLTTISTLDQVNLGSPVGPYAAVGVAYDRFFTGGVALVNPSPTQSATIALGGTYWTLGRTQVTSVKLGPESATILTAT